MFNLELECPEKFDDCSGKVTIWAYLKVTRPPTPPSSPPPMWPQIDQEILPQCVVFRFKRIHHSSSTNDIRCCPPTDCISNVQPAPVPIRDEGPLGVPIEVQFGYVGLPSGKCTEVENCVTLTATFDWLSAAVTVAGGMSLVPALNGTYGFPVVPGMGTASIGGTVTGTAATGAGGWPYPLSVDVQLCDEPCRLTVDPRKTRTAQFASDAKEVFEMKGKVIK